MRALITGATGFVGHRLLAQIEEPVVLSRNPERAKQSLGGVQAFEWHAMEGVPPREAFEGVEAVFHLAGDSIAEGRWTEKKKQRIRDTRVVGTRNLVDGMAVLDTPPKVLISASAIGYYGDRGDAVLEEDAEPGDDFLAEVCKGWEAEARRAEDLGIRVANPRIGVVLGHGGGALAKMLTPFKLGLGGRLGSGKQWMSWVHLDDLVGMMLWAAKHDDVKGAFNAVAPNPVTNRDFTKTLAGVVHRPAIFPVPGPMLRLALGEFANFLLASQRIVPRRIERSGYQFHYPELREALEAAVHPEKKTEQARETQETAT